MSLNIDLGDGVWVESYTYGYILKKSKDKKNVDTGKGKVIKDDSDIFGYYTNFDGVMRGYVEHRIKRSKTRSAEGLLKEIQSLKDELIKFQKLFRGRPIPKKKVKGK